MTATDPGEVAGRPIHVSETLTAAMAADRNAVHATTALYTAHYRSLVGLAVLLVRDVSTAEEIVQDSFVAMHSNWRRLRDSGKALWYVRQCVVNRSRSVIRHRMVVDRKVPQLMPDMPSAEQGAMALLERSAVIAALHGLPARQREVLVLRYYVGLSEAEIARTLGISQGTVSTRFASIPARSDLRLRRRFPKFGSSRGYEWRWEGRLGRVQHGLQYSGHSVGQR